MPCLNFVRRFHILSTVRTIFLYLSVNANFLLLAYHMTFCAFQDNHPPSIVPASCRLLVTAEKDVDHKNTFYHTSKYLYTSLVFRFPNQHGFYWFTFLNNLFILSCYFFLLVIVFEMLLLDIIPHNLCCQIMCTYLFVFRPETCVTV